MDTLEDNIPRARAGHCAVAINSRLYVWSGRDGYRKAWNNQVCCKDLWYLETGMCCNIVYTKRPFLGSGSEGIIVVKPLFLHRAATCSCPGAASPCQHKLSRGQLGRRLNRRHLLTAAAEVRHPSNSSYSLCSYDFQPRAASELSEGPRTGCCSSFRSESPPDRYFTSDQQFHVSNSAMFTVFATPTSAKKSNHPSPCVSAILKVAAQQSGTGTSIVTVRPSQPGKSPVTLTSLPPGVRMVMPAQTTQGSVRTISPVCYLEVYHP